MPQNFCDGLPVRLKSSLDTSSIQPQTGYTAQSPTVSQRQDSYYIPSPTQQTGESSQSVQSQVFLPHINTSIPPHQQTKVHSTGPSAQAIFPTPPSTTYDVEDMDNYSYNGSPASGHYGVQSIAPQSSVASPSAWSPQDPHQISLQQQQFGRDTESMSCSFRGNPMNYEQQQQQQQLHHDQAYPHYEHTDFSRGANSNLATMDCKGKSPMALGMTEHKSEAGAHDGSPQLKNGLIQSFDSFVSGPVETSQHSEQQGAYEFGEVTKHEPDQEKPVVAAGASAASRVYAKLMHKAFLTRPTHAMTLQQLYQWFRENTDKGKNESKGWQNSIRHNLSMNQAFDKRERKPGPDAPLNGSGETKKTSEWFLQDWAIAGVQSTTRYRNKGQPKGRQSGSSQKRGQSSNSKRAQSGRKGGQATSATRSSREGVTKNTYQPRPAILDQGGNHGNFQQSLQNMVYDHHTGFPQYNLPVATGGELMTPENSSHGGMMLTPHPMQAGLLPISHTAQGFPYTPEIPSYNQGSQSDMYPVENMAGMYQGSHTPAPTQGGQPLATSMPQDLSPMFENSGEHRHQPNVPAGMGYWSDPITGTNYWVQRHDGSNHS
ncbi:hypothetical protein M426DRAFT_10999 [Hypoxylon sp. CI-4A]|nr:hypothetical protein M426DRAFT_10999 [Hypoxylon sp. CI-4A]